MNNYDLEDTNVDLSQSFIESLMDDDKIKKYVKKKKTEDEENDFVLSLLTKYIGVNSDKIVNKKFSTPGFFLGSIYLIYRKYYKLGFLYLLLIALTLALFYNNLMVLLVLLAEILIINLVIGFQFNKRYLETSFNRVKQIESRHSNLPDEAIEDICIKRGGTSVFMTVLIIIVVGLISFGVKQALNNPEILSNLNLTKKEEFNGKYVYDKNSDISNVSFAIPTGYISKSNYIGFKEYSNGNCVFSIGKLKEDVSEETLEQYVEKNGGFLDISMINNHEWFRYVDLKTNEAYYKTTFNDEGYLMVFKNYSTCTASFTNVINSIRIN